MQASAMDTLTIIHRIIIGIMTGGGLLITIVRSIIHTIIILIIQFILRILLITQEVIILIQEVAV